MNAEQEPRESPGDRLEKFRIWCATSGVARRLACVECPYLVARLGHAGQDYAVRQRVTTTMNVLRVLAQGDCTNDVCQVENDIVENGRKKSRVNPEHPRD